MTDREQTPSPDDQELIEEVEDNFVPDSVEEVLPQAEPSDPEGQLP